jgi:hypothetical protein
MKYFLLGIAVVMLVATVVVVTTAQRSLFIVAKRDLSVVEDLQSDKVIGTLRQGQKARILRCEDTKHYIQPIVELSDGTVGVPEVQYDIVIERTGFLSRPQFPGCPGY